MIIMIRGKKYLYFYISYVSFVDQTEHDDVQRLCCLSLFVLDTIPHLPALYEDYLEKAFAQCFGK